jgi:RNA polymerase primary sigma factor
MTHTEVTDEQLRAAQAGDSDAMWHVVSSLEPMIRGLIRTVAPGANEAEREDCLQEARAAVIQFVRDYNSPSVSAKFSTRVFMVVRRAIVDADLVFSTPVTVEPTAAHRVRRALTEHHGDVEATWSSFRDATDPTKRMSRESFVAMLDALEVPTSLDTPVAHSGGVTWGEGRESVTLADITPDDSTDVVDTVERSELARWILSKIPARQSLALRAHYGVNMAAQTDAETSDDMGIKPAALRKLRSNGITSARRVVDTYDLSA